MNILSKIKDSFLSVTEDVDVIEKIKEEKEKSTEKKEKEPKRNFPVFFDDEDFEEEVPIVQTTAPIVEKSVSKKQICEKKFKPTPIISPIHGVVNKNDEKTKPVTPMNINNSRSLNVDQARKLAFDTMIIPKKDFKKKKETLIFDELLDKDDDSKFNKTIDMHDLTISEIPKDEIIKKINENTAEFDIYNLINEMYKEEEDSNDN
ncbi:MAG: hypothetical protein ACK5HL_03890 [Bacilli bacterium]